MFPTSQNNSPIINIVNALKAQIIPIFKAHQNTDATLEKIYHSIRTNKHPNIKLIKKCLKHTISALRTEVLRHTRCKAPKVAARKPAPTNNTPGDGYHEAALRATSQRKATPGQKRHFIETAMNKTKNPPPRSPLGT